MTGSGARLTWDQAARVYKERTMDYLAGAIVAGAVASSSISKSSEVDPMTTATHTPGEWHIGELRIGEQEAWSDEPAYERSIYADDGTKIAVCEQWIGYREAAEAEANARLIAAAPALLAAGIMAVQALSPGREREALQEAINAATASSND